jgi:hypothetical protein
MNLPRPPRDPERVAALFAAHQEAVRLIRDWLQFDTGWSPYTWKEIEARAKELLKED